MLSREDVRGIIGELLNAGKRMESSGVRHNLEEYLAHARRGPQSWRKVPCYTGWLQCHVQVDGTVLPCGHCGMEMGNLAEQGFSDIWNGARFREFRRLGSSAAGLASLAGVCDCANCCQIKDNLRVHRVFRWVPRRKAKKTRRQDRSARGQRG